MLKRKENEECPPPPKRGMHLRVKPIEELMSPKPSTSKQGLIRVRPIVELLPSPETIIISSDSSDSSQDSTDLQPINNVAPASPLPIFMIPEMNFENTPLPPRRAVVEYEAEQNQATLPLPVVFVPKLPACPIMNCSICSEQASFNPRLNFMSGQFQPFGYYQNPMDAQVNTNTSFYTLPTQHTTEILGINVEDNILVDGSIPSKANLDLILPAEIKDNNTFHKNLIYKYNFSTLQEAEDIDEDLDSDKLILVIDEDKMDP